MNSYTVEELYRLAQNGNTEALVKLGICYKEGNGVAVDFSAAAQCFFSAANAGNAAGQYQLAKCYEDGIGIEKKRDAAQYWYQEAAKQFYEAARLGNPQAQYGLANCYAEGNGVEQNPEAAVYWYQAAAQQDYPDAQYNLGYCYLVGIGVEPNDLVALKWYQSAASHGDPQMQHNLGLIYKNGYGSVQKNYGKAAEWFFKSARQGYSASKMELALIYFRDPEAIKDVSVAERLMTEAAEDGILDAQIYLAHYYFERKSGKYDLRKAYVWASKAANQVQDPTIAMIIGTCYANGKLFDKDEKLAYDWLSQVEEDTDFLTGEAAYYLGRLYQQGQYVVKSYEKASMFYELSQKKGWRLADEGLESLRLELESQTGVSASAAEEESPLDKTMVAEEIGGHEEQEMADDQEDESEIPAENAVFDDDDQMLIKAYEASIKEAAKRETSDEDSTEQNEDFSADDSNAADSFDQMSESKAEENVGEENLPDEDGYEAYHSDAEDFRDTDTRNEEDDSDEAELEEEDEDALSELEDEDEDALPELEDEDACDESELESDELEDDEYPEDGEPDEDGDWEFPSTFNARLKPVDAAAVSQKIDEHAARTESVPERRKKSKRPPVEVNEISDMEDELVDYEGDELDPELEDENEEWEASDDNFIASLLATGAKVTKTTMATPKRKRTTPVEEEPAQESFDEEWKEERKASSKNNLGLIDDYAVREDHSDGIGYEDSARKEVMESEIEKSDADDQEEAGVETTKPEEADVIQEAEKKPPVRKLEMIIDEDVLDDLPDEVIEEILADENPDDSYDEVSAKSMEPISKRLGAQIPINEVNVDSESLPESMEMSSKSAEPMPPEDGSEKTETSAASNGQEASAAAEDAEKPEETVTAEDVEKPEETVTAEDAEKPEETVSAEDAEKPEETVTAEDVGKPEETVTAEKLEKSEAMITAEEPVNSVILGESETSTLPKEPEKSDDVQNRDQSIGFSDAAELKAMFESEESAKPENSIQTPESDELEASEEATDSSEPENTEEALDADRLDDANSAFHQMVAERMESELDEPEKESERSGFLSWFFIGVASTAAVLAVAAAVMFATGNVPEQLKEVFHLEEESSSVDGTTEEDVTNEESSEERSSEEQILEEQTSEEQTSEEQTSEEQTLEEQTSEEQTSEEQTPEETTSAEWSSDQEMTEEESLEEETVDSAVPMMETEESPEDPTANEEDPEESSSEEESPEESFDEEESLKESSSEEENPEESSSEEESPEESSSEEVSPEETSEEDATVSVEVTEETSGEAGTEDQTDAEESQEETTAVGENPVTPTEPAPSVPVFSDRPYAEIPVPASGCVFAKLGPFDEKNHMVYAGKQTEAEMAHVAEFANGMNLIGETVYYYVEDGANGTVYSVHESGVNLQTLAGGIEAGSDVFIMNNSIFAGNKEYIIGENPAGTQWMEAERFLSFSTEYAYYVTSDGQIGRERYDRSGKEILELPFAGSDIAWAQVIDRYLLLYHQGYDMLYSYDMESKELVSLPLDGIAECEGLAANGNWVYGIYRGKLVRVRPNGSGMETVLARQKTGTWSSVVHTMENYVVVTMNGKQAGEYLVDLASKQVSLISREAE